ncbi:MAG: hypothetical protein M1835_004661 [Candelina submexicana]|nr:MAG: hypothetical protein M1835_004661 [Candelina submexicana]
MAPLSVEPFGGRGSDQNHLLDNNGIHRADASVGYSKEELPAHGSDGTRRGTLTESSDESAQASPTGTENPNTTSHYSQNFEFDPESSVDSFIKGTDSLSIKQAQLPSFNGPQSNKGNELDWPNLYLPNGSDEYSGHPIFPSQLAQPQMKADPDIHMGTFGTMDEHANHLLHGLYATPLTLGTPGLPNTFANWNLDSVDPLQRKADRLIAFCSNDGPGSLTTEKNTLQKLLTVDNFRHFVEKFTNFQGHWPMIHMPTFDLMEAYDGLVLAIICIGAIYSERPSPGEVRILMENSKRAIERSSEVYGLVSGGTGAADNSPKSFESATSIDELQSLTLLQILCVWHGDPNHRESARNNFAIIALLARKTGLLQLAEPGNSAYSVLHQHGATDEDLKADFNWLVWVEQEKRIRLMFGIWLLDVALIQYFNDFPAKFNAFEVRIPLPADDTTWDAKDPEECAVSLGLNGPEVQKLSNVTGSRLKKQPLFHHALKTLLEPTYNFQPRSTNVYSKFILIHALLADIFKAQRTAILSGNHEFGGSGTTTPINENSWVHVSDEDNGPSNGQSTPISADSHRLLKSTSQALAKWKKAWDTDIALQYPPSTYNYRRFGFCRDGVHFYWLAVALLRGNRAADVQLSADARFIQVMKMLKNVKNWAASDGAQRGEEIGSVGDIDESYGVDSITLDMKKLFTPIDTFDSPVSGVQTNLGA